MLWLRRNNGGARLIWSFKLQVVKMDPGGHKALLLFCMEVGASHIAGTPELTCRVTCECRPCSPVGAEPRSREAWNLPGLSPSPSSATSDFGQVACPLLASISHLYNGGENRAMVGIREASSNEQ